MVGPAYQPSSSIDRLELRQLTYFVAVAEELHFGRAAKRLHIAGPSLSQQISNLERELGTQLLVRDRRHVELTPAGSQFLTDAREVLGAAARAVDRTRKGGRELPLRLGYVSWLPPEAAAMPDLRVRVDEWVLPSHTQATRVAEGSLDLAIAWIEEADVERHNLAAHLLRYESLDAVLPRAHQATRHESVPASEITVLVDVDEAALDRLVAEQIREDDDLVLDPRTHCDQVRDLRVRTGGKRIDDELDAIMRKRALQGPDHVDRGIVRIAYAEDDLDRPRIVLAAERGEIVAQGGLAAVKRLEDRDPRHGAGCGGCASPREASDQDCRCDEIGTAEERQEQGCDR